VRVALGEGALIPAPGIFNDKPYIAAWGHGNAIVTWSQFHVGPGAIILSAPILASVTHDSGNTWTDPVQISGSLPFGEASVPVMAADGSIYVAFTAFQNANDITAPGLRDHYKVVKVDPATGQPLAAPVEVGLIFDGSQDYPVNVNAFRTYQDSEFRTDTFGNITADPTNAGHLAVVWSDMRDSTTLTSSDPYQVKTNSDIIISQSFDGGVSWSKPAAIQQPNDQFQPWGAYDASGHLQIGYYDRSYDPANHKYGYTLASETKAGSLRFGLQQLTTALSDPTQEDAPIAGLFNPTVTVNSNFPNATTFMGDYSAIAVTAAGVGALWTDMRLPSTFPAFPGSGYDAFFADPPGAGPSAVAPAPRRSSAHASSRGAHVSALFTNLVEALGASEKVNWNAPANVNWNAPASAYVLEVALRQWLMAHQTLAASGSMADSLTLGNPNGSPANVQLDGPPWTDPFAALGQVF